MEREVLNIEEIHRETPTYIDMQRVLQSRKLDPSATNVMNWVFRREINHTKRQSNNRDTILLLPKVRMQSRIFSPGSLLHKSSSNQKKNKNIKFHTAQLRQSAFLNVPGPLVDNIEPFSGMGYVEFYELKHFIMPDWNHTFRSFTRICQRKVFWKYGTPQHCKKVTSHLCSIDLKIYLIRKRL